MQAQQKNIQFSHLSVDDGLSQSTVFSIVQDQQGFMWFGTRDGLNKYDARSIKTYKHHPQDSTSLSNNAVMSLLTDTRGQLWVGTGRGLNLYDPQKDHFRQVHFTFDPGFPGPGNHIISLLEDRARNIWVGTRKGLILLPQGQVAQARRFLKQENPNSLVHNEVRRLIQDQQGAIWIGTSNGLSRLVYKGAASYRFTNYFLPEVQAGQKSYNWINALADDGKGLLWIGTEKSGLKLLEKRTGRFLAGPAWAHHELASGKIRTIQPDQHGDFWIGSIGGLYIVNPGTRQELKLTSDTQRPGALSDHSIRSMYIDPQGMYWIGTFYGGVNYYSPRARQFGQVRLEDLAPNSEFKVTSKMLTDAAGNLWIGTEGSGLYYLNKKTNTLHNYRHSAANPNSLSHDNIKTIMMEKGGLWIGTLYGLNFLDLKTKKFTHYFHRPADAGSIPDDICYSIKRDSQGTLWVATYNGGLSRFDEQTRTFRTLTHDPRDSTSLSSNSITYIYEDSRRNLWVGTANGLNKKLPHQDKFQRYLNSGSEDQALNASFIQCIHEDRRQRLWISTQNGLCLLMPQTGKVRYFTVKDGLPANTVYGILEDSRGYLWFSTQKGLSWLDPATFTFKNYNRRDGLISREFSFNSFHQDKRGFMYFGGYNGLVFFHPDSIRINGKKPEVLFSQLRLYNQEVQVNGDDEILPAAIHQVSGLEFRHDQNMFSVEFAVLNFINAEKNQYAYKLEGFDPGWNYVAEPVASYMNLKPGHYTLLVKGSNNDGIWSAPKALQITILPPPWKTWWAYLLYGGVFLGLLWAWSQVNKTKLGLSHKLELELLENKRQEELHQTKINFFANIAHELRTPLTLIVSPVQLLADKYRDDAFLQNQLKVVTASTDRLLRLLNQLLDFNKQENGNLHLKPVARDMVSWLQQIKDSFREHARRNHVELAFSSAYRELIVPFDPEELEKVMYNLLSNAFKFTPQGGRVQVRLDLESAPAARQAKAYSENIDFSDLQVKIVVEDTGMGIAPAHLKKIFNRFYQADSPGVSAGGFGIGLALSKEIVSLHGGTIAVESRERQGHEPGFTRFTILLPALQEAARPDSRPEPEMIPAAPGLPLPAELEEADPATEQAAETAGRAATDKVSVLLVEDNAEIRTYLKNILSPEYLLLEAADGQQGWELAAEKLPNLVISDVSMPRMDGLELTRLLKSDERTSHLPVILLTARGTVIHQLEGLEHGADEYLCKPFNIQLLLLKVKNLLAVQEKLKRKYGRIVTLQPQYQEIENPDDKFLQRLMRILEEHISDPEFNVSELVSHIGMSRPVLFRKTKMLTGLSVIDLIRSVRLKKAEMLLKQNKMTISEVAYEVGYNDPKYFSKLFRSQFGKTPSEYLETLRN